MRVFLDANVLFSASREGSHIARLVDWLLREAIAVTSDLAREEARRNLELKRPGWLPAFERLLPRIEVVATLRLELGVALHDGDVPILSSAVHAGCTHFATGDRRDFGHLFDVDVAGCRVVHLLRLAELLAARSG